MALCTTVPTAKLDPFAVSIIFVQPETYKTVQAQLAVLNTELKNPDQAGQEVQDLDNREQAHE